MKTLVWFTLSVSPGPVSGPLENENLICNFQNLYCASTVFNLSRTRALNFYVLSQSVTKVMNEFGSDLILRGNQTKPSKWYLNGTYVNQDYHYLTESNTLQNLYQN